MKNQRAALLTPYPAFNRGGEKPAAAIRIVRSAARWMGALALGAALGAIALYRALISPLIAATFGPACRFEPTCSQYAHQALAQHGLARGLHLTIRRLLRCRPLGGWGYDPVPAPAASAARHRS